MFKGNIDDYQYNSDLVIVDFPKVLEVIKCDDFISMEHTAQILYFYLLFHSKNGFCSCSQSIIKMIGSDTKDFQTLLDNYFIDLTRAKEVVLLNYEDRFEDIGN